MGTSVRLHARVATRSLSRRELFTLFWVSLGAAAALCASSAADAAAALCHTGNCRAALREPLPQTAESASILGLDEFARADRQRTELSDQEYFSFSGIGALVCSVNGQRRTATAFLVGAFDIGVTVAHPFVDRGVWARPEDCVYTTTDSLGQIRERIPIAYIEAQWQSDAKSFGDVDKDFAVIRLVEPSRYAQRTMPLGKFSGRPASVLMVGFKSDFDTATAKLKTKGHVYDRETTGLTTAIAAGFAHDMNASDIAHGAPVIDEHTGVTIGVHTQDRTSAGLTRNTMIAMNEWLEATLRREIQLEQSVGRVTIAAP